MESIFALSIMIDFLLKSTWVLSSQVWRFSTISQSVSRLRERVQRNKSYTARLITGAPARHLSTAGCPLQADRGNQVASQLILWEPTASRCGQTLTWVDQLRRDTELTSAGESRTAMGDPDVGPVLLIRTAMGDPDVGPAFVDQCSHRRFWCGACFCCSTSRVDLMMMDTRVNMVMWPPFNQYDSLNCLG